MTGQTSVVTRFAPSPTGNLNIGGVRTGIFAYLFARHEGGKFLVRIEDTDLARSKKEYEDNIFESLQWLGIEEDARFRQSEHAKRHEEELRRLVEDGMAYVSEEQVQQEQGTTDDEQRPTTNEQPIKDNGQRRTRVIRFRNPNTPLTFTDAIRGEITFDTTELGDFVLAKSFTEPIFHFAVVVDDWDEGVTHVVRGEDHISNTPRQILIQRALGAPTPVYAHLPLIVGPDHAKLSKRRGAKSITEYREAGYLPEAILNFDALLGWHPKDEREVFSKEELVTSFDISRVQKSPAVFDEAKLLWFNREHLKRLAPEQFAHRLREFMNMKGATSPAYFNAAAPLLQERCETLLEAADLLAGGEFTFLGEEMAPTAALLVQGAKAPSEAVVGHLRAVSALLEGLSSWSAESVKEAVFPYATEQGRAAVLWPLRVALSGREKSPDPFIIAGLLGKEKTLERISRAAEILLK